VLSVKFAIERLGENAVITNKHKEIYRAKKVIFPGVGQAKSAMRTIFSHRLDQVIPDLEQPVLGICLGMQLLCKHSEEGNTIGLGIFPVLVKKFNHELKIPHIGWNQLGDLKGNLFRGIPENSFFYFVHSYYVANNENSTSLANYGTRFSASIQKDNFYACQFHPEKSGDIGQLFLKNFLEI
jgi:glutamine amidotransferase